MSRSVAVMLSQQGQSVSTAVLALLFCGAILLGFV
jgi:hypothetical protein